MTGRKHLQIDRNNSMWKIKIEYDDKSKLTLTGKHKDIPIGLAIKYHNKYIDGKRCNAVYQQYPKKDHEKIDLFDKIEELIEEL